MKKQKIELVEAVHKARARSTKLLEEQGISTELIFPMRYRHILKIAIVS